MYKDPHEQKVANKAHADAYRKRQGMIKGMIIKMGNLESQRNYWIIACACLTLVTAFLFYEVFKYHSAPITTEVVFVGQDASGRCKTVVHQVEGRLDHEWKRDNLRKAVELNDNLKNIGYIGRTEWQMPKDTKPPQVIIRRKDDDRKKGNTGKSGKN